MCVIIDTCHRSTNFYLFIFIFFVFLFIDTFHQPTHLFLASMFPDICRKVWRPLVEKYVALACKVMCVCVCECIIRMYVRTYVHAYITS
jgi:hypothetical protein